MVGGMTVRTFRAARDNGRNTTSTGHDDRFAPALNILNSGNPRGVIVRPARNRRNRELQNSSQWSVASSQMQKLTTDC